MHKDCKPPQSFEEGDCPDIPMALVESNQVACIGHCAKTNTLAVQFRHGAGHIYHYHNVSAETHAAFMAAESKGQFFKDNIKQLAFKKYPSPRGDGLMKEPAEQADVQAAIELLHVSADSCEKNAPIHEAEGNAEQAYLSRSNAASYRAAIARLS